MKDKKLTSANGRLIADNQNIQTAGQRGPVLLQDPWFLGITVKFRWRCKKIRQK